MGKFNDLFSLTPEKQRNYVEDPTLVKDAEEAYANRKDPSFKMTKGSEAPAKKESLAQSLGFLESLNAPSVGEASTPPAMVSDMKRGIAPFKETVEPEGINVDGAHNTPAPTQSAPAGGTADFGKGLDIPWGDVIVGALPYALEGLFGGGKYMGSAGLGSAAGSKVLMDARDKERTAKAKADQLEADRKAKADKLAQDKTIADEKLRLDQERLDLEREKANNPEYGYEVTSKDGKDYYVGLSKKGMEPLVTNIEASKKPWNDREKGINDRFKEGRFRSEIIDLSKREEKETRSTINAQEYYEKYNKLDSFSPKYAKVPDTELPQSLKNERLFVRRMVQSYVVENAGTAQTDHEVQNTLAGLGMNVTSKTLKDLALDPMGWADKISANLNSDTVRNGLDSIARGALKKQETRFAGYDPEVVDAYKKRMGFHTVNISPTQAPSGVSSTTIEKGKSIADKIRQKRGY